MTTEHPGITCTGNPDPEPVPAHTCQRGPLCGARPEDGNPDLARFTAASTVRAWQ